MIMDRPRILKPGILQEAVTRQLRFDRGNRGHSRILSEILEVSIVHGNHLFGAHFFGLAERRLVNSEFHTLSPLSRSLDRPHGAQFLCVPRYGRPVVCHTLDAAAPFPFPPTSATSSSTIPFICLAWAFISSEALADSSALAAFCCATLSISATALFI